MVDRFPLSNLAMMTTVLMLFIGCSHQKPTPLNNQKAKRIKLTRNKEKVSLCRLISKHNFSEDSTDSFKGVFNQAKNKAVKESADIVYLKKIESRGQGRWVYLEVENYDCENFKRPTVIKKGN